MKIIEGGVEYYEFDLDLESILESENLKIIKSGRSQARKWKDDKKPKFMDWVYNQLFSNQNFTQIRETIVMQQIIVILLTKKNNIEYIP